MSGVPDDKKAEEMAEKLIEFDTKAREQIPATIRMISGCKDSQTAADVTDLGSFSLPSPGGRTGGATTAVFLKTLYDAKSNGTLSTLNWVQLLKSMQEKLDRKEYNQVPMLSSSSMMNVEEPIKLVNDDPNGTKRAVLIGINYVGLPGQLSACHQDVKKVKEYLMSELGFEEENMIILMDDNVHVRPTKYAILTAYRRLVDESKPGDTIYCHFSGHGSRVVDTDGDEDDGYDETLVPVDFYRAGQIVDDDLLRLFVKPMSEGVTMTCMFDCCHSGTVLDLPYFFNADDDEKKMQRVMDFRFDKKTSLVEIICCLPICLFTCFRVIVFGE